MAIDDVGDHTGGTELDAEVDEAETNDDRDRPWGQRFGGLTPCEEAGSGEEEVGYHDWEAELRFCGGQ